MVALLAAAPVATSASRPGDSHSDLVSRWMVDLREAMQAETVTFLEIHGLTVKTDPDRHVEVRQWHDDPEDVRTILEDAVTVLEEDRFEITDERNLATRTVAFTMDLPDACPSDTTRFVIASTNGAYFHVGCAARDDDQTDDEILMRMVSPALCQALERFVPRELSDEDGSSDVC